MTSCNVSNNNSVSIKIDQIWSQVFFEIICQQNTISKKYSNTILDITIDYYLFFKYVTSKQVSSESIFQSDPQTSQLKIPPYCWMLLHVRLFVFRFLTKQSVRVTKTLISVKVVTSEWFSLSFHQFHLQGWWRLHQWWHRDYNFLHHIRKRRCTVPL